MSKKTKPEQEEEVSNLFETMLRKQRRGLVANEVSRKLAEAIQAARETGGKASLSISVVLKPTNDDQIMVDIQCDTKLPKQKMPPAMFWIGEGNTLHTSDPRQMSLPLREVERDDDDIRDVANG